MIKLSPEESYRVWLRYCEKNGYSGYGKRYFAGMSRNSIPRDGRGHGKWFRDWLFTFGATTMQADSHVYIVFSDEELATAFLLAHT